LTYYDLYERHAVVRRFLNEALGSVSKEHRILDVGGRAGLLGRFLPCQVVSINVDGSGDLTGSGQALPFASETLDAVVSIDTLEHLPGNQRLPFLRECLRVAQRAVVVAAPYGSREHSELERRLAREYESTYGEPHVYLAEHVAYGLPDRDDVDLWVRRLGGIRWQVAFAGDYVWQSRYFERALLRQGKRGGKRDLVAWLRGLWNQVSSWALFHAVRLEADPYPEANRLYLLLAKGG
jgi:hypothetical protein